MIAPESLLRCAARAGRLRLVVLGDPALAEALAGSLGGDLVREVTGPLDAVTEAARAAKAGLRPVVLLGSRMTPDGAGERIRPALLRLTPDALVLGAPSGGRRPRGCDGVYMPDEPPHALLERLEVLVILDLMDASSEGLAEA